jgi:hypothetical protein
MQQIVSFCLSPGWDSKLKIASQATLPAGMRLSYRRFSLLSVMWMWSHLLESTHGAKHLYNASMWWHIHISQNIFICCLLGNECLFGFNSMLTIEDYYASLFPVCIMCSFVVLYMVLQHINVTDRKENSLIDTSRFLKSECRSTTQQELLLWPISHLSSPWPPYSPITKQRLIVDCAIWWGTYCSSWVHLQRSS